MDEIKEKVFFNSILTVQNRFERSHSCGLIHNTGSSEKKLCCFYIESTITKISRVSWKLFLNIYFFKWLKSIGSLAKFFRQTGLWTPNTVLASNLFVLRILLLKLLKNWELCNLMLKFFHSCITFGKSEFYYASILVFSSGLVV